MQRQREMKELEMIEVIAPDEPVNVMISEDGRRLWVCIPSRGTILRAKASSIEVKDHRLEINGSPTHEH